MSDEILQVHDVCEAINGSSRGSGDPLPPEDLRRLAAWLKDRVANWTPTRMERFAAYDDAVLAMAKAALVLATCSHCDGSGWSQP